MYPQRFDQPGTENKLWTTKDVAAVVPGQAAPGDTCPGVSPGPERCLATSDRPDGCNCSSSGGSKAGGVLCKSLCCDATTMTCADASVCAAACALSAGRAEGCVCDRAKQCTTLCCGIDGTCTDASCTVLEGAQSLTDGDLTTKWFSKPTISSFSSASPKSASDACCTANEQSA